MRNLMIAGIVVSLFTATAFAHPPTDLEMKFDAQAKIMTVHMRHVSIEPREHYIRTISVSINGQEPQTFRYTHQAYPAYVEVSLPVDAKPGDTIHIVAKCIQGGSVEGDLQVPSEDGKKDETGKESTKAQYVTPDHVTASQNPAKKMP